MPSKKLSTLVFPVVFVIGGLWLLNIAASALDDAQSRLGILQNIGYWSDKKFVAAIGSAQNDVAHAKLALAAGILALGAALLLRFRSACGSALQRCVVDRYSSGGWLAGGLLLLAIAAAAWWQLDVIEHARATPWVPGIVSVANRLGGKLGMLTFIGGTGALFLFLALLHAQREEQRTWTRMEKDDTDVNSFRFFNS